MSKFADYYTHSPFAAMRTGRQPPCSVSRRHETLRSPQCPINRRHETQPSPREGIRRGVGQDTRENSISLNQYKRNINEYP